MKILLFLGLFLCTNAIADTPPPISLFKLKAGSSTGAVVTNGGVISSVAGASNGDLLTWNGSAWVADAPEEGGVTSVGLALPTSVFDISGSPVTSTGTLTATFDTQAANSCFMGPVGGGPATPAFRSLVAADIPTLTASKVSDFSTTVSANTDVAANTAARHSAVTIGTANGLSLATQAISLGLSSSSTTGALSSSDWSTFNAKGSGTVTAVSVASSNGLAGSSTGGATPELTLSTSVNGLAKGNGTALSAATAGTDYSAGTSALATGILKSTTTTGGLSIAVAGDFPTLNQSTSGNAATATALAANPSDCSADTWATTIAASGNLTCSTISDAGLAVSYLKADGSRALTGNWNAGAFNISNSGTLTNSAAGALSAPAVSITGAPVTGGSATTTKPLVNIETAGATSTLWNTSGTMLGVNAPSGFAGNILDLQVNGLRKWSLASNSMSLTSGSETIALTNDGTTICLDNTTHAGTCFLRFRPNTSYLSFGVGTNTNSWVLAVNQSSTTTVPTTSSVPNTDPSPMLVLHNSSATAGNYGFVGSSTAASDKITAAWYFFNDVHTAGSETGHTELLHNIAGTKTIVQKVLNKGLVIHSGTAPTAGTCGSSPGTPTGDSNVFKLTSGTGGISGTCAVTLPTAPTNGGMCQCRDKTTTSITVDADISGSTITLTTFSRTTGVAANFTASDVFECQCQYY